MCDSTSEQANINLALLFTSHIQGTSEINSTNGMDCCTRAFTSGGGSGAVCGCPASFLQVTHFLSNALIRCLAHGTQYI